ncbi:MAG: AlbA family DNA-binding domain-containing protein [Stenotrophomonas sp.]|uniref:AlbA family DNA-binding domain-containing protein n=1 Tax=Stenotrophomonas sp. TaxID=69392 RepID=UPI003D6D3AA5
MLADALLEELRSRGEGPDLDYKAERYAFAKATAEQKSELLKDILALANTHHSGNAYLLMGFRENPPYPAEVIDLPADGAIDDSRLQQFVNEKLETKLVFRYEEQLFDGKHIAVITVPNQPRPFYLTKRFGNVEANTVYVRRGSSTGIATPREIYRMGVADHSRGEALLDLAVLDEKNQPLADHFERTFLTFEELPDYKRYQPPAYLAAPNYNLENRNYWREGAEYFQAKNRLIRIRLELGNRSNFALSAIKLEVTWTSNGGQSYRMLTESEVPDPPADEWHLGPVPRGDGTTEVDEEGMQPVFNCHLGNVRPGEIRRIAEDLILLPAGPGSYTMKVRVLANELDTPQVIERVIEVRGESNHLSFDELQELLDDDQDGRETVSENEDG